MGSGKEGYTWNYRNWTSIIQCQVIKLKHRFHQHQPHCHHLGPLTSRNKTKGHHKTRQGAEQALLLFQELSNSIVRELGIPPASTRPSQRWWGAQRAGGGGLLKDVVPHGATTCYRMQQNVNLKLERYMIHRGVRSCQQRIECPVGVGVTDACTGTSQTKLQDLSLSHKSRWVELFDPKQGFYVDLEEEETD